MDKNLLRALLAVTLLHAASAEASKPRPLSLLAFPAGFPNPIAKYLTCGTAAESGADFCVPEGTWTALCSAPSDRAHPKRFEGTLSLVEGAPRVPGCDEHVGLLWHGTGKPGASYLAPAHVQVSREAKGQDRIEFEYAGQSYAVEVSGKTLRLELKVAGGKEAKSTRTLDLSSHLQALQVPRPAEVVLDVVGDLNGDGAPELLVTSERSGFTRRYEEVRHISIGVLVTLSSPPTVVGQSHGFPWSLYTLKDCKSAGLACDVMSYLEAHESCEHFAGEEGYDEERAAFLRERLKNCDKLPAQRQRLLRKYKSEALLQKVLAPKQE